MGRFRCRRLSLLSLGRNQALPLRWYLLAMFREGREPFCDVHVDERGEVGNLLPRKLPTSRYPVPLLDALAAAGRGCVLCIEQGVALLGGLGSIPPRLGRAYGLAQPLDGRLLHSSLAFASRMGEGHIINCDVPEVVADALCLQSSEGVGNVRQIARMYTIPVDEVRPAASAWAARSIGTLLLNVAVQPVIAVGTRAGDLQRRQRRYSTRG